MTDRSAIPPSRMRQGRKSANACVSGAEEGVMGVHFIKGSTLFDGKFDLEEVRRSTDEVNAV